MSVAVKVKCGGNVCDCSLEQLSEREREVLLHLAGHKTSKAIARELGIHENTVNKHLAAIRAKWGTFDRYETAQVFTQLSKGDGIHPPQISSGDDYLITGAEDLPDLPATSRFRLSDVLARGSAGFPDTFAPSGLEALDRRFGRAWRIAAIPVIGILLGMAMLVGVAIIQVLNDLL